MQSLRVSSDSRAPKEAPQTPPEGVRAPQTPPEGVRSTTRRITGGDPSPARPPAPLLSGVSAGTAPKPAPSRPSAESETFGRIYRIVAWLDAHKGAFSISRLISQTGYNLRSFKPDSKDDARVLSKLWPVIDVMLSEEERQALMKALRETG